MDPHDENPSFEADAPMPDIKRSPEHVDVSGKMITRRSLLQLFGTGLSTSVMLYLLNENSNLREEIKNLKKCVTYEELVQRLTNAFPQPDVAARDPRLKKIIEEHFTVICGNQSLEHARIIGIGETHIENVIHSGNEQSIKNAHQSVNGIRQILINVAQKGDLILFEGIDKDRPLVTLKEYNVNHDNMRFEGIPFADSIQIGGWDVEAYYKQEQVDGANFYARNDEGLKAVLQKYGSRQGRIFVIAGLNHYILDPTLIDMLHKSSEPYLLLGETGTMKKYLKE